MFSAYLELGIGHILDPKGLDHVLFLVVLVIAYSLTQWKQVIVLATAFTLGHSVTLAMAAYNLVTLDSALIELLIALSIAASAFYNLAKPESSTLTPLRYTAALFFGFIHGLGFSNYFRIILGKDSIILPLLGFNLGVEIAQVIIVTIVLLVMHLLTKIFKLEKKYVVIAISAIVLIISLKMVVERFFN